MQSPYCRLTVHRANPCSRGQPAAELVDSDPSTFQAPSCSCSWTYKNLKEANISNHPWDLIVGILYIHEVEKSNVVKGLISNIGKLFCLNILN